MPENVYEREKRIGNTVFWSMIGFSVSMVGTQLAHSLSTTDVHPKIRRALMTGFGGSTFAFMVIGLLVPAVMEVGRSYCEFYVTSKRSY